MATRRVADAGLADRVTVLGVDYRDLEAGTYDKLVSVEMIEAVDWRLPRRVLRHLPPAAARPTG